MTLQLRQAIKAFILLLFACFILILHKTGDIAHFIHPNYLHFSKIASVIFLILFSFQVPRIFRTSEVEHDHTHCGPWGCQHTEEEGVSIKMILSIVILMIPLLSGLVIPLKSFGADEALNRGIHYSGLDHEITHNAGVKDLMSQPVIRFDQKNYTDYMRIVSEFPDVFEGKAVEIDGFIVEDQFLTKKQKAIARFQVTHCVADAHASGFILENGNKIGLKDNTWVRIKGIMKVEEKGYQRIPVISVKSLEVLNTPKIPYIYS